MDSILRDVRYAARQLMRAPGFATVALLTLALGIGANSAIFTLLDQVMLRALPVPNPQQLVILGFNNVDSGMIRSRMPGGYYFSEPMYRDLAKRADSMSGLLARAPYVAAINWRGTTEQVDSELVSGNYFDVLEVTPAAGRLIAPSDDVVKNGSPVVVLSYAFWQRRFGGSRDVVGQPLSVNSHPFTIIGVAPAGFLSAVVGESPSIFVPVTMAEQALPGSNFLGEWRFRWLNVVGRLKPGVSREQAQAQLAPVWHSLRAEDLQRVLANGKGMLQSKRDQFLSSPLFLEPGAKGLSPIRNDIGAPLIILMSMVGVVLLIACANVATLLLARAAVREREISICFALGASRWRVLQQLLAESALLGLGGGALGLTIAPWVTTLLLRAVPEQFGISQALTADLDVRVLAFTFVAAVVTTILSGMVPSLRFSRPNIALAMKERSASVVGGRSTLRKLLVAGQISLSVVLLVAAGLFTRSLFNLKHADLGFNTDHVITFDIDAKLNGYSDVATRDLYSRLAGELKSLPETSAVASSTVTLLNEDTNVRNLSVEGYKAAPDEDMDANWSAVSPGFLHAMEIELVAGRDLSASDSAGSPKVCVVNEKLARRYFGTAQQAVGRMIAFGSGNGIKPEMQIVGVAHDSKYAGVREHTPRFVYLPYLQQQDQRSMTYYVRTSAPFDQAAKEIRRVVQGIDANLPVRYLETMPEHVKTNLFLDRLVAFLSLIFGGLAAGLAAIGLYGVLAYSVSQRTREIGIRVALGATRNRIIRLVLGDVVVVAGIAIGAALPLAFALSNTLSSLLYAISNRDPLTYAAVVLVVAATSVLAGAIPALRAAKLDPLQALRFE